VLPCMMRMGTSHSIPIRCLFYKSRPALTHWLSAQLASYLLSGFPPVDADTPSLPNILVTSCHSGLSRLSVGQWLPPCVCRLSFIIAQ
jgi:hypothetical protein